MFVIFITLFLTILLNLYSIGEKVQFFIGKEFLKRYFPGPLKGLLPLALFIGTVSLVESVNTLSLLYRIESYLFTLKHFSEQIGQTTNMEWGGASLKQLQSIEFDFIREVPSECPSKGVLTEYTNWLVNLFRSH